MPTKQGNEMKWNILKKWIKSEEKPVSHSWGSTYLPISLHHLSVIWFNSSNRSSSSINAVSCDCLNRSLLKSHKSCICFTAWTSWQCNVQVEQVKSTWWRGSNVDENIWYCLPLWTVVRECVCCHNGELPVPHGLGHYLPRLCLHLDFPSCGGNLNRNHRFIQPIQLLCPSWVANLLWRREGSPDINGENSPCQLPPGVWHAWEADTTQRVL